jgi:O-antigen/teichoic acid export membrane protein
VYHRIDRILIEYILDAKPLGLYATADNLAKMMSMVPLAFMASVFPVLAKQTNNTDNFSRMLDISYRWIIGWSVLLAGCLAIIGPVVVVFFYGDEFVISGDLLRILVWSQVAVSFGVVISQILISQNLQRYITVSTVIGACLNLFGNLLIIPRYGIVGASYVTLFSYFFASMISFVIFPATRYYAKPGLITTVKILLISGISLYVSGFLDFSYALSITVYVLLFIIGLYVFHIVTQEDFQIIKSFVRNLVFKTRISL